MDKPLYDADFYTWTQRQGELLRNRSVNEIDWDNVAEEIETLGRSEARELRSRYATLLMHLLKWLYQPERRGMSCRSTIDRERLLIDEHLEDNPGLRPRQDELFAKGYREARAAASVETGLDKSAFPASNPFTLIEAMDDAFFPDAPAA